MTTVFKRLAIGGRTAVFKAAKEYRAGGALASPTIEALPVTKALVAAKTKVSFLEVESLKGLPVNKSLSTKTIDPFLACYIQDAHAAYFK